MEERRAADEERKLHHAVERGEMEERSDERKMQRRRDGGEKSCILERRESCITQWRAAEERYGERKDGVEMRGTCIMQRRRDGGEEAASRSGDRRRAAEELDGGEESCR